MNWFKRLISFPEITDSILHDERTFYQAFVRDLRKCKKEVIIECPFITSNRMEKLLPVLDELMERKVRIHILTRDPSEHDEFFRDQAANEILRCYEMGIKFTLLKGNFHRKLAIIDERVTWEGSLNILSQCNSREIMRRIESKSVAKELTKFLNCHHE